MLGQRLLPPFKHFVLEGKILLPPSEVRCPAGEVRLPPVQGFTFRLELLLGKGDVVGLAIELSLQPLQALHSRGLVGRCSSRILLRAFSFASSSKMTSSLWSKRTSFLASLFSF
jgi:hypothetical protein